MRDMEHAALPLAVWPAGDRAAFAVASRPGDPFDEGGSVSEWRPATQAARVGAYGRWLGQLLRQGVDLQAETAPVRTTRERIDTYLRFLRGRSAAYSITSHLGHLHAMMLALWPRHDWRWLSLLHRREQRLAEPIRNKAARIVPQEALLELGCQLMVEAETRPFPQTGRLGPRHPALMFRDGLLIALLAMRPLRKRNLLHLEIGSTLRQIDDGWEIALPGTLTKNHTRLVQSVPAVLVPSLETYLARYRPRLAEAHGRGPASTLPHLPGKLLWLSRWGSPITPAGASHLVDQHTRARFGHHVNCHLFRDCAATSIAGDNPEHVRIAADLLGHRSVVSTQRFYIAANQRGALHRLQGTILSHRKAARRPQDRRRQTPDYPDVTLDSEAS